MTHKSDEAIIEEFALKAITHDTQDGFWKDGGFISNDN